MSRSPARNLALTLSCLAVTAGVVRATPGVVRRFADRPIAWQEHDDTDVPTVPEANHLQVLEAALMVRDSVANEADRILSLEGPTAALDVNAVDEVPCSTWFCARNHLRSMTVDDLVAGAPGVAPRLPLTIVKGKDLGAASGYQVKDADGRRYMLKFDVVGHLGMANAGEMIGSRVFHAAGYNVPATFTLDLRPEDIRVSPAANFLVFRVQKRPLTEPLVRSALAAVARAPDGRIRAVAVSWIPGTILGGFDMLGVRRGDPNDRIPHQHRRSVRASWVLYAWLSVLDASSINTIDSYVDDDGRRFVRHYYFDFGCAFGSATHYAQGIQQDGEYIIEVGRTLASLFSFGLYRRPFQDRRDEWNRLVTEHPALGYYPADGFDPDSFRGNRKLPSHMRLTERDAYWGAKLVTSFSDAQIAAMVSTARLGAEDSRYLEHALRVRRDIIGRRYLRAIAAVESPTLPPAGDRLCFRDLAIARGYAPPAEVRYQVEVSDGGGNRSAVFEQAAVAAETCVPIGAAAPGATGYRVVEIRSRFIAEAGRAGNHVGKASRVHLRWRDHERGFAIVGLERDE
jgi:hypothetical protein